VANVTPTVPLDQLLESANRVRPATLPIEHLPVAVQQSTMALASDIRRFHGTKVPLTWFPLPWLGSTCADRFGYMCSAQIRNKTRLPFDMTTQTLVSQLGDMMGNSDRSAIPVSQRSRDPGLSSIPAGYTYFGQFVDHDITFDVSSALDNYTDATSINNMRSPSLDLDSVYGRGPGLDPFLYVFPTSGPATAIKLQTGTNFPNRSGGPSSNGALSGMKEQFNWDVPRIHGTNTAVIGDPRNDENLIISQFHHAMLRFHNAVVDLLVVAAFAGDIFAEAKRIVTHHYQWAVVNDFLVRLCGAAAVDSAMANEHPGMGSAFAMPVEFSVGAYRFGHSMVRDRYMVNFRHTEATLAQLFFFIRKPLLPVFSDWVVDFNAFFETGVSGSVLNRARKIDSFMANELEFLPGFSGVMRVLATRNLRRGLALGLPSGQGMAEFFGINPMSAAKLTLGLPGPEVDLLNSTDGLLLRKTPLWYYILREAAVLMDGNQLGPVGGRIVAETFIRILRRDRASYLNVPGRFIPTLTTFNPPRFTVADLVVFAGVTRP
jgi:hypothetical protein